jgi:hypothetical protein
MLDETEEERQHIVDYLASQAHDERVEFLQKLYSERVNGITQDIWDVHTDKERWWIVTPPPNLYSQRQFPNMDLALTFHLGLCLRIPRGERPSLADAWVEPFLGCWRAMQQANDAIGTAQEIEDYQAIGVRCREAMLTFIRSARDALSPLQAGSDLNGADFLGWTEVLANEALSGPDEKPRRGLLKTFAGAAWQFANWLTHARSAHVSDAEAAISATAQTLSLFTAACIRRIRGVPDSCPSCSSQRLAPERGVTTDGSERTYERPVCRACGWTGEAVELSVQAPPSVPQKPESDCVVMEVPLRGLRTPKPSGPER